MINLHFEAPKGTRLHRYFWAVTLIGEDKLNIWFNTTTKTWEQYRLNPEHGYSTHAPCRTLKAFKRMLRKSPHITGKSCLVNRYKGYDIYSK
jgi:hypothetical protein